MPIWKRLLLELYYHGSMPYRRRRNRRLAEMGRAPVIVLVYHRVADDAANLWTRPNRLFEQEIRWLKRTCELVSLEEAQRRIRLRMNHEPCVSITFDDGYADNCRHALPLLVAEQVPCTYFVTTRNVLEGVPFEHDLRMGNNLTVNTIQELRELAAAGIEIGAHTRTHADLGATSDSGVLHDEVVTAGEELQAALGRPVRYFAFPYGQHRNLNAAAFHIAYEAGYEAACSAYGGYNYPGDDAFHIQRIGVDGPTIRLRNWIAGDPVKERRTRRFFYGVDASRRTPTGVART